MLEKLASGINGTAVVILGVVAVLAALLKLFDMMRKFKSGIENKIDKAAESQNQFFDVRLRTLNGTVDAIIDSFPGPAWIKIAYPRPDGTVRFVMQRINKAYEERYGKLAIDYVGKEDRMVWDRKTADEFFHHDLGVYYDGKPAVIKEEVEGRVRHYMKVRLEGPSGVKGIMGYEIPEIDRIVQA